MNEASVRSQEEGLLFGGDVIPPRPSSPPLSLQPSLSLAPTSFLTLPLVMADNGAGRVVPETQLVRFYANITK